MLPRTWRVSAPQASAARPRSIGDGGTSNLDTQTGGVARGSIIGLTQPL